MVFMLSAGFGFPEVAKGFPESRFWQLLRYHCSHVPWTGGGAWDMIQPAFIFMVGVALPFSVARRTEAGESRRTQLHHALRRSAVLIGLGLFLSHAPGFALTNVLAQIGLGYMAAVLLVQVLSWLGDRLACSYRNQSIWQKDGAGRFPVAGVWEFFCLNLSANFCLGLQAFRRETSNAA